MNGVSRSNNVLLAQREQSIDNYTVLVIGNAAMVKVDGWWSWMVLLEILSSNVSKLHRKFVVFKLLFIYEIDRYLKHG